MKMMINEMSSTTKIIGKDDKSALFLKCHLIIVKFKKMSTKS